MFGYSPVEGLLTHEKIFQMIVTGNDQEEILKKLNSDEKIPATDLMQWAMRINHLNINDKKRKTVSVILSYYPELLKYIPDDVRQMVLPKLDYTWIAKLSMPKWRVEKCEKIPCDEKRENPLHKVFTAVFDYLSSDNAAVKKIIVLLLPEDILEKFTKLSLSQQQEYIGKLHQISSENTETGWAATYVLIKLYVCLPIEIRLSILNKFNNYFLTDSSKRTEDFKIMECHIHWLFSVEPRSLDPRELTARLNLAMKFETGLKYVLDLYAACSIDSRPGDLMIAFNREIQRCIDKFKQDKVTEIRGNLGPADQKYESRVLLNNRAQSKIFSIINDGTLDLSRFEDVLRFVSLSKEDLDTIELLAVLIKNKYKNQEVLDVLIWMLEFPALYKHVVPVIVSALKNNLFTQDKQKEIVSVMINTLFIEKDSQKIIENLTDVLKYISANIKYDTVQILFTYFMDDKKQIHLRSGIYGLFGNMMDCLTTEQRSIILGKFKTDIENSITQNFDIQVNTIFLKDFSLLELDWYYRYILRLLKDQQVIANYISHVIAMLPLLGAEAQSKILDVLLTRRYRLITAVDHLLKIIPHLSSGGASYLFERLAQQFYWHAAVGKSSGNYSMETTELLCLIKLAELVPFEMLVPLARRLAMINEVQTSKDSRDKLDTLILTILERAKVHTAVNYLHYELPRQPVNPDIGAIVKDCLRPRLIC